MDQFEELLEVAKRLNGPDGCPWDVKQTFSSLRPFVIEEAHELLEAVDENLDEKIIEELGDLFYTIIFYAKIAEREGRFTIEDVIEREKEKLIRRHPHVFGDAKVDDIEGVVKTWEKVKKEENKKKGRESLLDGIPPTLPMLFKAQKVVGRLKKAAFPERPKSERKLSSKELQEQLLTLIAAAVDSEIDIEMCLRGALGDLEESFRKWEKRKTFC